MNEQAQYRVVVGKKDERVEGPDDADVVVTVPLADAERDPTVAFMQGRLKASGDTGLLFRLLRSGEVAAALKRLAAS
ncbi:MAG: SCP2 sterol-binding domain-containing protein [Acidimicrobiia bacterium]